MKKYYDIWNIPWSYEKDEINLIIKDNYYVNEIDKESIFYCDTENEIIHIGKIILEIGNVLYIQKEKFFSLFIKYKSTYTIPNMQFVKECFCDLINIGLSQLIAHAIVDYIIISFKKENTFKDFYIENSNHLDEWIQYPLNEMIVFLFGQLNPIHIMSENYLPIDSVFKTHIVELNNELISVCTELDLWSLINLDALYSRKNKLKIIQCNHCKTFFIKAHGNNTKWCKNCAAIDFGQKNDEFYQLYRTKQKTMLQRSYRCKSMDIWEYQEKYTSPWETEIKRIIDVYRKNNDFNGFENYITKSMNEYKPPKERK